MNNVIDYFKINKLIPRDEQKYVLEIIEKNWSKYKYFALSCPPGVGKSHIALAIADAVPKTYLLTGTKYLQEQYVRTSAKIVDLKGRSNYVCNINPVFNADEAPCLVNKELKKSCLSSSTCDYYNQKKKAINSQMMITNYAYFLTVTSNADEESEWVPRDVIIMDEAHDLEKHLISIAEIRIKLSDLYTGFGIGDEDLRFSANAVDNRVLLDQLMQMMQAKIQQMDTQIEAIFNEGTFMQRGKIKDLPKATGEKIRKINTKKSALMAYVSKIMIFTATREFEDSPWVETPNFEENSIVLSPLTSKYLFNLCMDSFADKFVFMSATLPPADVLCREMGIDQKEMCYIEVGTPFPAEKSPIVILPVAKMGYRDLDKSIPVIVQAIEAILENHPDEKGLIHSGNYRIATEIFNGVDSVTRKRLISRDMHGEKSRIHNSELLKMHSGNNEPTVLISPSMTTGIDLFDDLSRFQIIVKLPFLSLGDARIKKKMELTNSWYTSSMVNALLQASCRSTRSIEDHSTTYILDAAFLFVYENNPRLFPDWFKKRLNW
jgi:ATP-dependent DNA helicase DinG